MILSNTRIIWIFPALLAATLPSSPSFAALHHGRPSIMPRGPIGARLSGTARGDGSSWQFEIVINRSGNYFRKEWSGNPEDKMGFYRLVLIMDRFRGEYRRIWSPIDVVTGTGYGRSHGQADHEVARRLFTGTGLAGESQERPRVDFAGGMISEQFQGLQRLGSIRIPSVIVWDDRSRFNPPRVITYTIQHSQLLFAPQPAFFRSALKQYFPKAVK